jgi:hypothetical protein
METAMKKEVVHGYRPIRSELKVLAAHWAQARLDVQLDWFYYQMVSSDWNRRADEACRRLAKIARSAGEDLVRAAVAEVEAKAKHSMGPEMWEIFMSGSKAEREGVSEDIWSELEYHDRKKADAATQAKAFAFLRDNPGRLYFDEAGDMWFWSERPPEWAGGDDGCLLLRFKTSSGGGAFAVGYTLPRPAGWVPPYGLGSP